KSKAGAGEKFWDEYNLAYCESVGVPADDVEYAAAVLNRTRSAYLWRWPIPDSVTALGKFAAMNVPMAVVSNASGQIAEVLQRSRVCQRGDGPCVAMREVIDSHLVGVAKPDPRIFDFALAAFEG